jgi:pimeloyl-ACP methyl ester carboxylesterase
MSSAAFPCRWLLVLAAVALSAAACGGPELVLSPDPARGVAGADGPFGVLTASRTVRVRGDEPLVTHLAVPTRDGEAPSRGPAAILIHGGFVDATRSAWLAAHLASRGLVVAVPENALGLAFFSPGNAPEMLDALRRDAATHDELLENAVDDGPALVAGHSLGGVVASSVWHTQPAQFSHLALFASIPNPDEDVGERTDGRVLSLAGGGDGRIGVDEVVAGAEQFRAPTTVAVVDTMTHFQWVDDVTESEIESDAEPAEDTDEVRARALVLIDALAADLRGEPTVELADGTRVSPAELLESPSLWPAGLALPARDDEGGAP